MSALTSEICTSPKGPRSVFEMFAASARKDGDLPFLIVPSCAERSYLPGGARFSYADAMARVTELAAALRDAGYGRGHCVALVLGNRPEHFWYFLALNSIGACAVLLNPEYMVHEFAYALEQAEASLAIVDAKTQGPVRKAIADGLPIAILDIDQRDGLPPPAKVPIPDNSSISDLPALIIYTSGTTSRPKGCVISNGSCLESGRCYAEIGGLITLESGRERLYVPLPSFHMNCSVLALNAMILKRGCLISSDRFRASTWWQEIRETEATGVHYLGLIPPVLLKVARTPDEGAPTVRFGLGAGIDPVLHAIFEARFGFPLVEVWGMTETSRIIANAHEPRHLETRAFGKAHPPWEVMVVDDEGAPVSEGEPGEMLVRCAGPDPRAGFFSGYVNDDDATRVAWRGGWFHTGDIVRRGSDGMLYFVDRRKNIIRRSGENIAAAEVEEAFINEPAVSGIAVLAVPDEVRGEEVLACIILAPDVSASETLARSLIEQSLERLALHKAPGWIQFVSEIPTTATQKVRKEALLEGFTEGANAFDVRAMKIRRRAHANQG
jgi:acyl-CoA synthetase (AMP-forming)/AMP-acid ligase II